MKYDIISVVYETEISMLGLQAQSTRRFAKDVGKIIIINNANSENLINIVNDRIQQEVIPLYGELADRVEIHTVVDMIGKCYPNIGWQVQQLLKLMASRYVENELTLILDAKSFFISPCGIEKLADNGKCFRLTKTLQDHNVTFFYNACDIMQLNETQRKDMLDNYKGNWTPFVIWSDTFREACAHFVELTGKPLEEAFNIELLDTFEFYLIEAYIAKKYGLTNYYEDRDTEDFFRLHRRLYNKMTEDEANKIANDIKNNGIYDTDEAAKEQISKIIKDIRNFKKYKKLW